MQCRQSGSTLIIHMKKGLDFPAADFFENRVLVNALNGECDRLIQLIGFQIGPTGCIFVIYLFVLKQRYF